MHLQDYNYYYHTAIEIDAHFWGFFEIRNSTYYLDYMKLVILAAFEMKSRN